MAARNALRFVSRRFSTGGKVLSEEEKAAENVYIKAKMEQDKLEKIAKKGPNPVEQQLAGAGGAAAEAKTSGTAASATPKVSDDKYRNYAVVAGVVTIFSAVGWYLNTGGKKQQEAQD